MDVAYTCFRNTVDIILFRLTPLMLAVRNNHSRMVSLLVLLGSGRSVNPETGKSIKNYNSYSILFSTDEKSRVTMCQT